MNNKSGWLRALRKELHGILTGLGFDKIEKDVYRLFENHLAKYVVLYVEPPSKSKDLGLSLEFCVDSPELWKLIEPMDWGRNWSNSQIRATDDHVRGEKVGKVKWIHSDAELQLLMQEFRNVIMGEGRLFLSSINSTEEILEMMKEGPWSLFSKAKAEEIEAKWLQYRSHQADR